MLLESAAKKEALQRELRSLPAANLPLSTARTGILASTMRATKKKEELQSVREWLYPMMRDLADGIDRTVSEKLELSPFKLPEDMQSVEGMMENGRCVIENSAWQSPEFRKIHLELATFFNEAGEVRLCHFMF